MIELIEKNKDKLQIICKKHMVKTLFLFGSAAKNEFNSLTSDLDFLVEFSEKIDPIEYADNYFSFLDELKKIYQIKIDLLSTRAIKNPILVKEINQHKVQLYAA